MKFTYSIFLIGMILLCSIVFPAKILTVERNHTKIFSIQHQKQTIEAKTGESFLIVLPNPGAGGYIVQDPEFDSQILKLLKMDKKPPSESNRVGDFGSFEWTFLGREEGISKIVIRAFRPWERDKAPIILFKAIVRIIK